MAALLYRIGRASFERRGRVLGAWLLVLAALAAAVVAFMGPTSNAFSIPGTESQRALDALRTEFPQAAGASGTIVLAAPEGSSLATPQAQAAVGEVVAQAAGVPGVLAALPPAQTGAISPDGRYALVQVQFVEPFEGVTAEQRAAFEATGGAAQALGIEVAHGGEIMGGEPEIGSTEGIGVAVAALVLVLTFGSLVAAGMTMLTALIGVGIGMAGVFSLSGVVDLTSTAPILALMLGLAVGIDYSLFIISRYRQNLAAGRDPADAIGRAVGTAGSAVLFAGATVVIALAALAVAGIPFLTVMGLAAAGTVAVAVLVAVTLSPALLGFAGRRVLPRKVRRAGTTAGAAEPMTGDGLGARWARWVTSHRLPVVLLAVAGLAVLAVPATELRLALPSAAGAPEGSSARVAHELTAEGFGPGFNAQLVVVLSGDDPAAVGPGAQQVAAELARTPGVLAATPPQPSPAGTTALIQVIPAAGPTDVATEDLVGRIRDGVTAVPGTALAVTGTTAVGIDVSDRLADALPRYLLIVVGLSFLLLMLAFRSVLVPLKATLGFLLTIGATFGVTVAVFQWGWLGGLVDLQAAGPLISFLPILLVGILFGLAMDYEVFLVSRMREDYVHGAEPRAAIVSGLGSGARVVAAAAVIMISVFAGFALIEDTTIKSMGFALAVGVLIDAFLVRMTIVPAVLSLLGRHAWWLPGWLDRALPDLDFEGARLDRRLNGPDDEPEPALTGAAPG